MRRLMVVGIAFLTSLALAGCGGSSSDNSGVSYNGNGFEIDSYSGFNSNSMSVNSYDKSYSSDSLSSSAESYDYESEGVDEIKDTDSVSISAKDIKSMLVYSGQLDLRTKTYNESYTEIQNLLSSTNSFIERSEYSINQSGYSADAGLRTWTARVRIPSVKYDEVTNGLMQYAEVSRFISNVENLTAEYSDLMTSIDLYKASRTRYLTMLESVTDDDKALAIERELRSIEEQLARYEARAKVIETDVAYSYLDIELKEVREYEAQTGNTESFGTRLWNKIVNTFLTFLQFLEGILFLFIGAFPYLVILVIIIFVVVKIVKKSGKPYNGGKPDDISEKDDKSSKE